MSEALQSHLIDADLFAPFVVARLEGAKPKRRRESTFAVTLQNLDKPGQTKEELRIKWEGLSALHGLPPVQDRIVTEWAACGVACALVWFYTGLRVLSAAEIGERFDYWVGNDTLQWGLEVSGTLSQSADEMLERHRQKRNQLLSHPAGCGYVVIVGFARREVILSFHASED